ncbi:MAG: hypothetical protein IT463_10485, partial [Planctomycetes bacterium]|nr:hypothetical protein [Planctomycetota bacterium]
PVWAVAGGVHNGALYVLNGWDSSIKATSRLQKFSPGVGGTGGTINQMATPDNASGYHSGVFHDGKLWFFTGRDSYAAVPKYALRYSP